MRNLAADSISAASHCTALGHSGEVRHPDVGQGRGACRAFPHDASSVEASAVYSCRVTCYSLLRTRYCVSDLPDAHSWLSHN